MTNRQIQICPTCNRATEIVFIHGHGQCGFCKTNIDPCCSVGFQEKDAQLLVILSIVLNLIPQLNLLSVKICQSNWILNNSFCLNGTVLGNLDDRFRLNSMVFLGNKESPSQTIVCKEENKCMAGIQENHPLEKAFQRKRGLEQS